MNISALIAEARALGASDLLCEAGTPIVVRVRGELSPIAEIVTNEAVAACARALLDDYGWQQFQTRNSADHSTSVAGVRCRINVYRTVRGTAIAIRLLSTAVTDVHGANLHPDLARLTETHTGLLIISGPTGSGKSTTLASLVEEINQSRARNIITLESPIEYLHTNRRSFIRQREIPTHSPNYEQAIVDALRENPDVLVIGEMRTPEVMRLTLNAAETGHLVLATMHSATCAEAIARLCMSFPSDIQSSVRAQLADCLVAVLCQRLDYLPAFDLRVPRCEVLIGTSGSRGAIRAGQFSQIATVIQSGGEEGMWTFDRYERWIAKKQDWVMPSPVDIQESKRVVPPTPAPVLVPKMKVAAPPRPDETIEINPDDDVDLQEIARRLDEGKL